MTAVHVYWAFPPEGTEGSPVMYRLDRVGVLPHFAYSFVTEEDTVSVGLTCLVRATSEYQPPKVYPCFVVSGKDEYCPPDEYNLAWHRVPPSVSKETRHFDELDS